MELIHIPYGDRARIFATQLHEIAYLNLAPLYDAMMLSVEPFHVYARSELLGAFHKQGYAETLCRELANAGMQLISRPLFDAYSEAINLMYPYFDSPPALPSTIDDFVVDPLYGFVFWAEGPKHRNKVLTMEEIIRTRQRISEPVFNQLYPTPSAFLVQGVALAADLLRGHSEAVDSAIQRSEVPEIIVHSEREVRELCEALAKRAPQVEFWFRGQNRDYLAPDRSSLFGHGIVPYGDVVDSSLITSLYRSIDATYERPEEFLRLIMELGWWRGAASRSLPFAFAIRESSAPAVELAPQIPDIKLSTRIVVRDKASLQIVGDMTMDYQTGLNNAQTGLLLQHYGAPTGWLDITDDVRIATWFARHSYSSVGGTARYDKYAWRGSDPASWPTIFLFPFINGFHPFLNTHTILQGTTALRPKRQACGLMFGGGNLVRNYGARFIGLKLRLAPDFNPDSEVDARYLFPGPDEDECLAALLESEAESVATGRQPTFLVHSLQ